MQNSIRVVESVGWLIISPSMRILSANPYAAKLFDRQNSVELCGLPINDFLPNIDELLTAVKLEPKSGPWEIRLSPSLSQIEMIMVDILEGASKHQEGFVVFLMPAKSHEDSYYRELTIIKQENLDIMLSQVVHELRNPLAGIKTTSQLLQKILADQETPLQLLTRIINQTSRIENLLKMLAIYVKPPIARPVSVQLENIIGSAVANVSSYDKEAIRFDYQFPNLSNLYIDPDQVNIILTSLLQNAIEAMPDGGTITITATISQMLSQNNLDIKVSDNGVGISEEILPKVFTPFFTTKIRGLGLGLAIVGRLVAANDGSIKIESTVHKGTTVTLSFPIAMNS